MMLPEIPPEQFQRVLEDLAWETLLAADVAAAPVDAFTVAESLDLSVACDEELAVRARLVRLNFLEGHACTSILLAPEPRPERRHWSVAHEIGEQLAAEACSRLGIGAAELPAGGRERLANLLAGRLLLPARWFAPAGKDCSWDLRMLKRRFATASHELIARRMLDFLAPAIISVYDHDRLTWRRSNLPGRLPPISDSETRCRAEAHQTAVPSARDDERYFTRAWPIHEPEWKREIVRAEPLWMEE